GPPPSGSAVGSTGGGAGPAGGGGRSLAGAPPCSPLSPAGPVLRDARRRVADGEASGAGAGAPDAGVAAAVVVAPHPLTARAAALAIAVASPTCLPSLVALPASAAILLTPSAVRPTTWPVASFAKSSPSLPPRAPRPPPTTSS